MARWISPRTRVLIASASLLGCDSSTPDPESKPAAKATIAAPVAATTWPEHTSKRCLFAVELPGPLSPAPPPPGLLDQIASEDRLRQVAMLASCGDVPSVGSPQEFLEVSSGAIARQLHAQIDQRTELELQGRPGLELKMTVPSARKPPGIPWPGDLSYTLRLFVAGTRQYQQHMLHPTTAEVDDMAERFFAGFRLLDDAPAAATPLAWTTHTVADLTVEAPGRDLPQAETAPETLAVVRFGEDDRSTPYALSLWKAALPGAPDDPAKKLRAHFMLRVATEHTEIIEQIEGRVAGRSRLDVVYRPNLPLPDHIAPDTRVRAAVQDHIDRNPSTFRLRLILDGDRIVQLLAAGPHSEADAQRFFDSLVLPD